MSRRNYLIPSAPAMHLTRSCEKSSKHSRAEPIEWKAAHKRIFCLFLQLGTRSAPSQTLPVLKKNTLREDACVAAVAVDGIQNTYWGSKMFWRVLYCSSTIPLTTQACCPVARMQRGETKKVPARGAQPTLCNLGALEGPPLFPLIPQQITCWV
jgi:hypothetical protein